MSISDDFTKKTKQESESSVSKPQSENTTRAGRACDDDYPDRIVHHNERPARDRPVDQSEPQTDPAPASEEGPDKQGRKKKEPDQLTTYDLAGLIPFSEWDGEEGQPPHN